MSSFVNYNNRRVQEEEKQTMTKLTARGEKSQAWTKTSGYAAINGKIVFPAPQPTYSQHQLRYNPNPKYKNFKE